MITYRREIDGLRALAVVPVMLFHAGFKTFSGGFVGVDVFFVISGYLITSIIVAEKQAGRFTLSSFYERRARRILPALFLVIFACLPAARLMLLPSDMKDFSQSIAAVSVFASNFLFWQKSGYFDSAAELRPLLHTWSLAVEEQYYVLFPIFLLLIWRYGKAWILGIFAFVGALSLAFANLLVTTEPTAAFYLLHSRAWELLLGAIIALYLTDRMHHVVNQWTSQIASLLGLVLILVAVFAFDHRTPFPGLYALVPVVGTALIILYASPNTVVGSLLSTRLFVGVGLISYSAYLWHQPLLAFGRHASLHPPAIPLLLSLLAGTFVLAYISWRFVELPFRNNCVITRQRLFVFAVLTSVFLASVGLAGHLTKGFEHHYLAGLDPWKREVLVTTGSKIYDNNDCHFHSVDIDEAMQQRFDSCQERFGRAMIILGDSHAVNMYEAISLNTKFPFVVGISRAGCRPHTPSDACPYNKMLEFASARPEAIELVVYTQAGFYLLQDEDGTEGSRAFFRIPSIPVYLPNPMFINRVIDYLNKLSRSTNVIWIGPRIEPHLNVAKLKRYAVKCQPSNIMIDKNIIVTFEHLERAIKFRLASETGFSYVSQADTVPFDPNVDLYKCGEVYWADTDHWNLAGALRFGHRLVSAIDQSTHINRP